MRYTCGTGQMISLAAGGCTAGSGVCSILKPAGRTPAERALRTGNWSLRSCLKERYESAAGGRRDFCEGKGEEGRGRSDVSAGEAACLREFYEECEAGIFLRRPDGVLIVRCAVPDFGRYRVRVRVRAVQAVRGMNLYLMRRNLAVQGLCLEPGEVFEKEFFVCVTPYIPACTAQPLEEKAVYVSVSGEHAGLSEISIEPAEVPTVFVAGDSTLTDSSALFPVDPAESCTGWAQNLLLHLDGAALNNQAHSGMTTVCFRDDGHLAILEEALREGDIVLLQFGHNDQKRRSLKPFGGYADNLREYVKRIRARGASPVLVTSISRVPYLDTGEGIADAAAKGYPKYVSLLEPYAQAVREVGRELDVPVIDLHTGTFAIFSDMATDGTAHRCFIPGDITHTNTLGAALIEQLAVKLIRETKAEPLWRYIREETSETEAETEAEIKAKTEAESGAEIKAKAEAATAAGAENGGGRSGDEACGNGSGNALGQRPAAWPPEPGSIFDLPMPYVDADGHPLRAGIERAFRAQLLDPCVMYVHPDAPMPRAQLLMVLCKALRLSGRRPYTAPFTDIDRDEWDAAFVQAVYDAGLTGEAEERSGHFRPDTPVTAKEFAQFCRCDPADLGTCVEDKVISRAEIYTVLAGIAERLQAADTQKLEGMEVHPV